jgi:hypothetical protein
MPASKKTAEPNAAIAEELRPLYHLESAADNLGEIASALHSLANATALRVIAENGSPEDRERAVEILKQWFDDFREH